MKFKYELIFIVIFFILYFFFGNFVLHDLFIKDECYYHNHETPFYIELLFDFQNVAGYHPVPTKFGYVLFGVIGYFIGRSISKSRFKE